MGGHGGLNILPQKRWNVYNRDNRAKVARDEASHAAQEQELQAKHRAAEAEARRKLLLQRAKERRAEAMQSAGLAEAVETAGHQTAVIVDEQAEHSDGAAAQEIAEQHDLSALPQQSHEQHSEQLQLQEEDEEPVLEHINFWKDFEAKTEHPDRQKEKKEEKRKRGNPDTYTSDARFDESFQLGHGLSGPKPWYARAVDPCAEQQWEPVAGQQQQRQQHQQQQFIPALPRPYSSKKQGSKRSRSSSLSDSSSSSSDSDSSAKRRHKASKRKPSSSRHKSSKDRKHKKSHSRDKHKKSSKRQKRSSSSHASADAEKALAVARLRAERLEREAAERHRSLVATGQMPAPTKRYNSSYGYADALKASTATMGAAGVVAARGASAAAVTGLGQRFRR